MQNGNNNQNNLDKWSRKLNQGYFYIIKFVSLKNEVIIPNSIINDYTECPHCNRKFNESAAQRHIPGC
jgi:hypothetical protein